MTSQPAQPAPSARMATAIQRGMWLAWRLDPDSVAYTVATAARLTGPLDVRALQDGLDEVCHRHEILRTTFSLLDNDLISVAHSSHVAIDLTDLSTLPIEQAAQQATHLAKAALTIPFDLQHGPLVRAVLLRLRPEEHVLVLSLHHAVCDGWSMQLLLAEWGQEYGARTGQHGPPVIGHVERYWDHVPAAADGFAVDLGYWREQLRGAGPLDLPAPTVPPVAGAAGHQFQLDAALLSQVDECARDTGTTRYVVLLAAFSATLARVCRTGDVSVGTTVSTRSTMESHEAIGPLFNTVVLRTALSPEASFSDVLDDVREVVISALEHCAIPFEQVLNAVRADARSTTRNPLFNVFFELDHDDERPLELPGLTSENLRVGYDEPKTALMVALKPDGNGLRGWISYRTDTCDVALVAMVAAAYPTLLQDAVRDRHRAVSELNLLPAAAAAMVTEQFPDGGKSDVPGIAVHQWFERQVLESPHAIAVRELDGRAVQLTYAELNSRANRLARRLVSLGVEPESRVAVLLPRSVDLLVAFLAVWKAGGAYVPLDPSFPAARLRYQVRDSGAAVLITRTDLDAIGAGLELAIVRTDGDADTIAEQADGNLDRPSLPGTLAYVIYTSGSTGAPKGVLVEHHGLVNFLHWCVQRYADLGDGGAPLFSSVAFDMVVPNLYTPLLMGQSVHIVGEDVTPDRLGEVLASAAPYSFVKLTPGHLQLLSWQLTPRQASGLAHQLVVGADAFPASVLQAWRVLDPDTPVLNEYGPTEASVANCVHETGRGSSADGSSTLPIGRPIPNTTIYVLAQNGKPMPIGLAGELYIGGDCVARGYANKPAVTARSFVPDPFGPAGARLYRTGDLGRWRPDGELEFLGRIDDQVKIRGYRVEPGEVEAALVAHPAVTQALVTVSATPAGQHALVAYVVAAHEASLDTSQLRSDLSASLPDYLVPSAFVRITDIPLTENGKVDRSTLPEPTWETGSAEPSSDLERAVTDLLSQILDVPIGRHDNFFELGGNSLLALCATERLKQRVGSTLSFLDFLDSPTVAGISAAIAAPATDGDSAQRCLAPLNSDGPGMTTVFVHPLGGTVFCYRNLIDALRGVAPLYGLTLASLLGPEPKEQSLEELAARYADEIAESVTGPVVVAGWSAGAITAFETACQLRSLGVEVALLALLDPSAPDESAAWRRYVRQLRQLRSRLGTAPEYERAAEFEKALGSDLFLSMGIDPSTCRDYSLFPQDVLEIWQHQLELLAFYEPAKYDGPVAVLTSQEPESTQQSDHLDSWQDHFTEAVQHHTVDGDHLSMMQPPAVGA
ncbi:MAG TPA: amino acid adenylation domain-containing protein, partial [Jatrophihabitans sp.]|uniref:non-ribosomal peptide synthetase n=1 Tax=Jatrophihabitans sp. TaxID=1932789 RepID=UPI002F0F977F